jgi:hypothetical protein
VDQIAGPASSPRGARVDARDLGIYAHIICLNLFENKVDVGFPPKKTQLPPKHFPENREKYSELSVFGLNNTGVIVLKLVKPELLSKISDN